jgi:hypothetical protein
MIGVTNNLSNFYPWKNTSYFHNTSSLQVLKHTVISRSAATTTTIKLPTITTNYTTNNNNNNTNTNTNNKNNNNNNFVLRSYLSGLDDHVEAAGEAVVAVHPT